MATNIPTPAPLSRKLKLIWFALTNPARFNEEEEVDGKVLNAQNKRLEIPRVYRVRRALWDGLIWCIGSLIFGAILGILFATFVGPSLRMAIATVAIGTAVVLWATFSLQAWEIQSFSGVTLGERLNRWIFRSLYLIGTGLIVAGGVWSLYP